MTKLVTWRAVELLSWALESLSMSRIATPGASICILVHKFGVKISLGLTWFCFCVFLGWGCLCLLTDASLFLCFPGRSSVCWCHRRLICAACGSPATYLICLAWLLSFPFPWQAGTLCLWEISLDLYSLH